MFSSKKPTYVSPLGSNLWTDPVSPANSAKTFPSSAILQRQRERARVGGCGLRKKLERNLQNGLSFAFFKRVKRRRGRESSASSPLWPPVSSLDDSKVTITIFSFSFFFLLHSVLFLFFLVCLFLLSEFALSASSCNLCSAVKLFTRAVMAEKTGSGGWGDCCLHDPGPTNATWGPLTRLKEGPSRLMPQSVRSARAWK